MAFPASISAHRTRPLLLNPSLARLFSSPAPDPSYDEAEKQIHLKLAAALQPAKLKVQDISGGCGAQYAIEISSKLFAGKNQLAQHRMVNEILKEDIKKWHALRLSTSAVKE